LKTTTVWALAVIAVATIGGSVTLVVTGHSDAPIIELISTGVGLLAATGLISHKQEVNGAKLDNVTKLVNGNTASLIEANAHLASQIGVAPPPTPEGPTVTINGQRQALTTPPTN
jgi:hypothetical protein